MKHLLLIILIALLIHDKAFAQNDTLILTNNDVVTGEIKSMEKGILIIETDYSDSDFKVEWDKIREIYSKAQFLVSLEGGIRLNGSISSVAGEKNKAVIITATDSISTTLKDIVFLKGLKSDFWGRLEANLDIGLTLTKANNLRQLSVRSGLGYIADLWQVNGYYNHIVSDQDSVPVTRRTDAGISYRYYLQNDWFVGTSVNFLSNTEQAIDLRTTGNVGAGKMIVMTNQKYWALGAGLAFNNERFSNETEDRNSLEGYLGTELNLFDVGDLNLLSSLYVYGGITEAGRWRGDFKLDAKYDLPHDFYLKPGITVNYDNRPAIKGSEMDYVFVFTVGWEL